MDKCQNSAEAVHCTGLLSSFPIVDDLIVVYDGDRCFVASAQQRSSSTSWTLNLLPEFDSSNLFFFSVAAPF